MKKWSWLAALLLGVSACQLIRPDHSPARFELQLLHFADVDGCRDIIHHAVRLSAMINELRRRHPHTLVVSSGDNWIQGPEYTVASDAILAPVLGVPRTGRAHVALLNALGVQAAAFGNHEFDMGTGAIASLLVAERGKGGTWPGARFPYLAANLDFTHDRNLAPLVGPDGAEHRTLKNKIAASTVVLVAGEKIGIVGATTPTLKHISAAGDVTISPPDSNDLAALAAKIQTAVDRLSGQGVNKIILLAHMQQLAIERQLAGLLREVDIIVAGGSNTILADNNDHLLPGDSATDTYPLTYPSASHHPVLIVNTDGDYTYLGRLVVAFDQQGVIDTEALDDAVNGTYAADEKTMTDLGLSMSDAIPAVNDIAGALSTALMARAGTVCGRATVYLNGERGAIRTEETNFGTLVAQANLAYAQATDPMVTLALVNSGTVRAAIGSCRVPPGATGAEALTCKAPAGVPGINRPGDISRLDVETALRFNNALALVTVTGAELKTIVEHGVAASAPGATPGQFPQVAGMRFSFDLNARLRSVSVAPSGNPSAGARVRNLVVEDDNGANAGGKEVVVVRDGVVTKTAAAQLFRMVTLAFLVEGGDSYPFPQTKVVNLAQGGRKSGPLTFAADGTEQDALAEYLLGHFPADDDATTPAYTAADTPAAEDRVIQNLSVVATDTVLH